MGNPDETKTKLVDFKRFRQSLLANKERLSMMRGERLESCGDNKYREILESLKDLYFRLKVSESSSTIVAHSKTLAHILPDLIPPIDRQYTVRFFSQDDRTFFSSTGQYRMIQVPKSPEAQFALFVETSVRMKELFDRCDRNLFVLNQETFNTSYPKIIDNLIVAFVKAVPKPIKV